VNTGNFDSALVLLQEYAAVRPGDRRTTEAMAQLKQLKNQGRNFAHDARQRNNPPSHKKVKTN